MDYKKIDCKSYNIHTIKTDKFKTVRMEIVFSSNVLDEKTMQRYTFLADLLSDASQKYPCRKEVAIRLEELYKTIFYSTTNKVGNLFTVNFVLEFIAPKYINEKKYLDNVLSFPFEFINNPLVNNKEFDSTIFNIVKKRLKEDLESIKENQDKLALLNSLKAMDNTSPSSYRILGNINDIESITPSNLYDIYLELINTFNCDIFVIGDILVDDVINIIKNSFDLRTIKINKTKLLVNNKTRRKALVKKDESCFVQSTLVMIYNINNLNKELKDTAFHVYNYILGAGGITSKLYKSLRTDNSLCYGVRSLYLKYDELLIVQVSLDKENVKLAEKLIKKIISDLKNNSVSKNELENAIKNLIFALKMNSDDNVALLNNYMFNYLDELPLIEERIELIKNTKEEDITKCANSLILNTIYVLDAGDNNERD